MVDAPELTSITRQRSVRPLMAAWVFVFVTLVSLFAWLTLTDETPPTQDEIHAVVTDDHNDAAAASDQNVIIASNIPVNDPDNGHGENTLSHGENTLSQVENTRAPAAEDDDRSTGISLPKAPIEGLIMMGSNGPLPVLGPDSTVAWKEYARPSGDIPTDKPKIAILVNGIGLNSKTSDLAIKELPGQIDLGFSPYGRKLQQWMDKSRKYGHESFLMIPTEPLKYPENDPGPHTLLTGATARDNLKNLDWLLSRVSGYVGIINEMGSKFTASEADLLPVLKSLNGRGLMFVDSRSTRFSVAAKVAQRISMPRALNNLYIDNILNSHEIAKNLNTLENTARTFGSALGVARAFPLTIKEIKIWSKGLKARGIELVPITAIANRQPIR